MRSSTSSRRWIRGIGRSDAGAPPAPPGRGGWARDKHRIRPPGRAPHTDSDSRAGIVTRVTRVTGVARVARGCRVACDAVPGVRLAVRRGILAVWLLLALQLLASVRPMAGRALAGLDDPPAPVAPVAPAERDSSGFMRRITRYLAAQPPSDAAADLRAAEEAFRPFAGCTIRAIRIVRLSMFAGRPERRGEEGDAGEETRQGGRVSWLERGAEAAHADTRDGVVRAYLLFREGDRLDPRQVADSERLLRDSRLFSVAGIEVRPLSGVIGEVELLVTVRDLWSIGGSARLNDLPEVSLRVFERNLLGLGHGIEFRRDYDPLVRDRRDRRFFYRANNIAGSFIRTEAGFRRGAGQETRVYALIDREPVVPEIRASGAFLTESIRRHEAPDFAGIARTRAWERQDVWLGYNLLQPRGRGETGAPVVVLPMIRAVRQNLLEGPPAPGTAGGDQTMLLAGLHAGRVRYRQTRLVSGFGRVEDVPLGVVLAGTAGRETDGASPRPYVGGRVARAGAGRTLGTGTIALEAGGFRSAGRWVQGAAGIDLSWFSELARWGRFRHRQFVRIAHRSGVGRAGTESLVLDDSHGLRGIEAGGPRGLARWTVNLESVSFTPWDIMGFRLATYAFADVGAVAEHASAYRHARHYSSLGLGIRLKNEQLVLDAIDLRVVVHPSPPRGARTEAWRAGEVEPSGSDVLAPRPPEVVPYD